MIVLDTHIWVWWVHGDPQLSATHFTYLQAQETQGLGVSIISCWEVAKLVETTRLILPLPVETWLSHALGYPGVRLLNLTPRIVVESTQLPGVFHRDPADQMTVATARVYNCPLITVDRKILQYPHVRLAP
jgi:PIN domain nuclease of toxin-antitoxin system